MTARTINQNHIEHSSPVEVSSVRASPLPGNSHRGRSREPDGRNPASNARTSACRTSGWPGHHHRPDTMERSGLFGAALAGGGVDAELIGMVTHPSSSEGHPVVGDCTLGGPWLEVQGLAATTPPARPARPVDVTLDGVPRVTTNGACKSIEHPHTTRVRGVGGHGNGPHGAPVDALRPSGAPDGSSSPLTPSMPWPGMAEPLPAAPHAARRPAPASGTGLSIWWS